MTVRVFYLVMLGLARLAHNEELGIPSYYSIYHLCESLAPGTHLNLHFVPSIITVWIGSSLCTGRSAMPSRVCRGQ